MKHHKITQAQLDEWLVQEEWRSFASSSGMGSEKSFEVSGDGLFRVTDHDRVVYIGGGKETAIRLYNEAP